MNSQHESKFYTISTLDELKEFVSGDYPKRLKELEDRMIEAYPNPTFITLRQENVARKLCQVFQNNGHTSTVTQEGQFFRLDVNTKKN